tara:strand:- start:3430 stop:3531 length:102 start_codon:yes stop_codon:yes gene_type:complete
MKKPILTTLEGIIFAAGITTIFVIIEILEGVLQ